MRRTVTHFIDTVEFGGAEQALLHLLACQNQERWRLVLLHHEAPGLRPLLEGAREAGVELVELPRMRGLRGVARVPKAYAALRALRPDVFHAHLNWPLACSGGILGAAQAGVPVVATVQLFSPLPSALTMDVQRRLITRLVRRYIAVSEGVARRVQSDLGVPGDRVTVVPNGIELEPFAAAPEPSAARIGGRLRTEVGAAPGQAVVLTLARMTEQKGHRYLLEAIGEVPDAVFAFAGDGPLRTELEADAAARGLSERVRFLGHRTDAAALLADCDVLVLPSLYEGLPLAILEAMAAGKPVVASAIGGVDEAVEHGTTGLLVPPADPPALAGAIRAVLDAPGRGQRFGNAGAARVRAHFSAEATARSVEALYREIIEAHERS